MMVSKDTIISMWDGVDQLEGLSQNVEKMSTWEDLLEIINLIGDNVACVLLDVIDLQNESEAMADVFDAVAVHKIAIVGIHNPGNMAPPSSFAARLSGIVCAPFTQAFFDEFLRYAQLDAEITGRATVLVVDDSRTVRKTIFRELNQAGYKVLVAGDGAQALELAKMISPTVIVTDLLMPEIDGYELCQLLQDTPSTANIPVIVVTSLTEKEILRETFTVGVKEYIQKPWGKNQLADYIERLIVDLRYERSERAVLVDDSRSVRRIVSHYVNKLGFQIESLEDGCSLAMYLSNQPQIDIILLDWELPDIDGITLCKKVRQMPGYNYVPIIMLTGRQEEGDVARALKAGANDYITKPFRYQEFAARIQAHMRVKHLLDELAEKNQVLETLALTDPLTGLFNRRYFDERISILFAEHQRSNAPISLIFFDIDHFKRVNDTYGHPIGDVVIKNLAQHLRRISRKGDLVTRMGGEEFALLLPNTDQAQAWVIAERIRLSVEETEVTTTAGVLNYNISGGVGDSLTTDASNPAELIDQIDASLYEAKESGRNRIQLYQV